MMKLCDDDCDYISDIKSVAPLESENRTQFFQLQAIITGHISTIYRQTSDVMSVRSTGAAAA